MPIIVEVTYADGTKYNQKLPVETWLINKTYTLALPTDKKVKTVILDPENALPDLNRKNNSYTMN